MTQARVGVRGPLGPTVPLTVWKMGSRFVLNSLLALRMNVPNDCPYLSTVCEPCFEATCVLSDFSSSVLGVTVTPAGLWASERPENAAVCW